MSASLQIQTVIFDKDGTLIDFHAMWGAWTTELVHRLEAAAGLPVAAPLFDAIGYDPATGRVAPDGPLAIATMAELQALSAAVLHAAGLSSAAAEATVAAAWFIPDPVALAYPLADLAALFGALRARGLRIAIATSDDRAPTVATLEALGLAPLVDALACADDGIPTKPAPDAILAICRTLGIAPAQAVMVGDTRADMLMGRAAGAGLVVGVESGIGTAAALAPLADLMLPTVAGLAEALRTGNRVPSGRTENREPRIEA